MEMNTISIVTPVKNAPELLIETMNSIASQIGLGTQFKIQHIIIDGNSGDDTVARAINFIEINSLDSINYTVISEQDAGMYEAISKGFALCTGQIVAYQNAGDIYHVGAFAAVDYLFSNSNCSWSYGRKAIMNFDGTCVSDSIAVPYLRILVNAGFHGIRKPNLGFFQQESLFFRKESLEKFDFSLFSKFKLAGDFYLFQYLFNLEDGFFIDSLISGHRLHANQLSLNLQGYGFEMKSLLKNPTPYEYFVAVILKMATFLPQNFLRKFHSNLLSWNHADKKWIVIKRNRF